MEALFSAGDSLTVFPNRGRKGRIVGARELVAVHPYVIVYEVRVDHIVIQRIHHDKLLA